MRVKPSLISRKLFRKRKEGLLRVSARTTSTWSGNTKTSLPSSTRSRLPTLLARRTDSKIYFRSALKYLIMEKSAAVPILSSLSFTSSLMALKMMVLP